MGLQRRVIPLDIRRPIPPQIARGDQLRKILIPGQYNRPEPRQSGGLRPQCQPIIGLIDLIADTMNTDLLCQGPAQMQLPGQIIIRQCTIGLIGLIKGMTKATEQAFIKGSQHIHGV